MSGLNNLNTAFITLVVDVLTVVVVIVVVIVVVVIVGDSVLIFAGVSVVVVVVVVDVVVVVVVVVFGQLLQTKSLSLEYPQTLTPARSQIHFHTRS